MQDSICPLCAAPGAVAFHRDHWREYRRCARCALVYVPARYHVSRDEERRRYDLHENDPRDPGYRRFLERLVAPMAARLPRGARGLDFGCGPSAAMAGLFAERGFRVESYDPFYAPERTLLEREYDFLCCSEAAEHFCRPRREWASFVRLVRGGGLIGVMTQRLPQGEAFAGWYYKNDPTHVCFYAAETFGWLARATGSRSRLIGTSVALLERGDQSPSASFWRS